MLTPFDEPTRTSPYADNYPTEEQEREQQEAIYQAEYGPDYEEDKPVSPMERRSILNRLNAKYGSNSIN